MRYEQSYYDCVVIYDNRGIIRENEIREISFNNLRYNTFELIEDEIEIEGIEKLVTGYSESGADTDIIKYINDKIVPSIKQLNKEIKEISKRSNKYERED